MYRHLLFAAVLAATAFAQDSAPPARRSPEQIFQFLDKDKNGTLSEAALEAIETPIHVHRIAITIDPTPGIGKSAKRGIAKVTDRTYVRSIQDGYWARSKITGSVI